jgi:probable O-glycosylation ligase (exosortase A-associated)
MRDYIVIAVIVFSLPICFVRPYIGILVWTWVGLMNPHRLCWGVATTFPVAMLVGGATLLGFVISSEPKHLPRNAGMYALVGVWLCLSASTAVALHFGPAFEAWDQRTKILLMLMVTIMLVHTRERLRIFCLVMAASVGFFGFKGGLWALFTGGKYQVLGPDGSFLGGNNPLALAMNMTLPLLFYMSREVRRRSVKLLLRLTFWLTMIAVVSTYSRGGFLGLVVVAVALYLKNEGKFVGAVVGVIAVVGALSLVPAKWTERMHTIDTYQADRSAEGRLNAWKLAWRLTLARPVLGWGPEAMDDKTLYDKYYPDSPTRNDVHSSYFQLLAEGGFASFGVFVFLLMWCLRELQRLATRYRKSSEHGWLATYADMLQVGILGYVVSAAFLEMAFFDYIYYLVGATVVLLELGRTLAVPAVVKRPALVRRVPLAATG